MYLERLIVHRLRKRARTYLPVKLLSMRILVISLMVIVAINSKYEANAGTMMIRMTLAMMLPMIKDAVDDDARQ